MRATSVAALALVMSWACSARADVAFDNFGAGQSFNTGTGWTVAGPSSAAPAQTYAGEFTAGASGSLVDLIVAAGYLSGTNGVVVTLNAEISPCRGIAVLESWSAHELARRG